MAGLSPKLSTLARRYAVAWYVAVAFLLGLVCSSFTFWEWRAANTERAAFIARTAENILERRQAEGVPQMLAQDLSFLLESRDIVGWKLFDAETGAAIFSEGAYSTATAHGWYREFVAPVATSATASGRFDFHLLIDGRHILASCATAFVAIFAIAFVVSGLVGQLLFRRVRRAIVSPITAMADHFAAVRERLEPFERTATIAPREIQLLRDRFNEMAATLEVERERSEAVKRDAELGRLAAQVAHDIRSPLSSLVVAARRVAEALGSSPRGREALNLLELARRRLDEIASALLARYGGPLEPSRRVDLHEVCDTLIGEFQVQPLGNGVEFRKAYASRALLVRGERVALVRAIGNLIKNGLEAMQDNSALRVLTIATRCEEEMASLDITDTGKGMSAEFAQRAVEGGVTEGKAGGHGLGMRVVREAVEAMGGRMNLESQRGIGTRVRLLLPLAPPVAGEAEEQIVIPVRDAEGVAVIDDDAGVRAQWRMLLETEGVRVTEFGSWEEYDGTDWKGRTAIVDFHFDNSTVDGFEIIRRLQQRGGVACLLCTAEYWKESIRARAAAVGVPICPKPIPPIVIRREETEEQVPQGFRVLLIDDDELIYTTWKAMCETLQISHLLWLPDLGALRACTEALERFDVAFVDRNLTGGTGESEDVILCLRARGVPRIVLATGASGASLANDPHDIAVDHVMAGEKIPQSLSPYLQ